MQTLEKVIQEGLTTFYEVGKSLKEIRDGGLYKEVFGTFEDYCQQKWGMERRHAYRLIESSDVKDNLCPVGHILPANERQVRPLTSLEPEQQQEAWQRVLVNVPATDAEHFADFVCGPLLFFLSVKCFALRFRFSFPSFCGILPTRF